MCLAEALLRTPDDDTRDKLIAEKIGSADWASAPGRQRQPVRQRLDLGPDADRQDRRARRPGPEGPAGLHQEDRRPPGRAGDPRRRRPGHPHHGRAVRAGRTIEAAIKRAANDNDICSFDMLGEGARTAADAARYEKSYADAILTVGKLSNGAGPEKGHGVSVKLSALTPRYEATQEARVWDELYPRILRLALIAAKLRHQLHDRRRRGRPPGPVAEAAGPPVPRAGAGRVDRPGPGRPGLPEALRRGDRPPDRPVQGNRPSPDGPPGQGRLLGQRDQARPGRRPSGLSGLHHQAGHRPVVPGLRQGPDRRPPRTSTPSSPPTTPTPWRPWCAWPRTPASRSSTSACTAWARRSTRPPTTSMTASPCGPTRRWAATRTCCPIWSAACWRTAPTPASSTPCWTSGCRSRRWWSDPITRRRGPPRPPRQDPDADRRLRPAPPNSAGLDLSVKADRERLAAHIAELDG
jgi:hypothetical protein